MIKAILGLQALNPIGKATKAQTIKNAMENSSYFPVSSMPVSYVVLQNAITGLLQSITAAASSGASPSDTAHLHEQEKQLINLFNFIKSHVEYIANTHADPATVITAAGMQVNTIGGSTTVSELTLSALGNGAVLMRVPREKGEKAFVFEKSNDGSTWLEASTSTLAKVTIKGLIPGSTVYMRYCAITKTGKTAMSQVKSIIVT